MQSGVKAIGKNRPGGARQMARSTPICAAIMASSMELRSCQAISSSNSMPGLDNALAEPPLNASPGKTFSFLVGIVLAWAFGTGCTELGSAGRSGRFAKRSWGRARHKISCHGQLMARG